MVIEWRHVVIAVDDRLQHAQDSLHAEPAASGLSLMTCYPLQESCCMVVFRSAPDLDRQLGALLKRNVDLAWRNVTLHGGLMLPPGLPAAAAG